MEGAARAVTAAPVMVCGDLAGTPVHRISLSSGELDVSILTWGATIQRLRINGPRGPQDVVLGFDTCDEYLKHRLYMGCVVGRFANRIAGGRFSLDGVVHQLDCNENSRNHLHGGTEGFSRKVWSIDAVSARSVDLSLVSPDGEEGYPGTLTTRCCYSIEDDRSLRIALSAVTDAPTIVNLATHSYFNLDGADAETIQHHRLQIPALAYLPTDDADIPTGEFRPVDGTPFDFRELRDIWQPGAPQQRYDNTFVLAQSQGDVCKAARLESSGLAMEVWSSEPGIQFFDGRKMRQMPGRGGASYGPYSGLCLEPQRFPDSPNHSGFTDCSLYPGQEYRQITEYRFDAK